MFPKGISTMLSLQVLVFDLCQCRVTQEVPQKKLEQRQLRFCFWVSDLTNFYRFYGLLYTAAGYTTRWCLEMLRHGGGAAPVAQDSHDVHDVYYVFTMCLLGFLGLSPFC